MYQGKKIFVEFLSSLIFSSKKIFFFQENVAENNSGIIITGFKGQQSPHFQINLVLNLKVFTFCISHGEVKLWHIFDSMVVGKSYCLEAAGLEKTLFCQWWQMTQLQRRHHQCCSQGRLSLPQRGQALSLAYLAPQEAKQAAKFRKESCILVGCLQAHFTLSASSLRQRFSSMLYTGWSCVS